MSQPTVRRAFEKALATMPGVLSTAYENSPFTPVSGVPYQKINLLPAAPDNTIAGSAYFEVGLFQIRVCYPLDVGPGNAEEMAQQVRDYFKRGSSLVEAGIVIQITKSPRQAPAYLDEDRYVIPVSVPYQALFSS